MDSIDEVRARLNEGLVIPACPLALNTHRGLDERRQRALFRYYLAAGAGGVAVGVHTTQFAIRDPKVGLFRPVLELAAEELRRAQDTAPVRIAGICGDTKQAAAEASLARELGYHCGLLSLGALRDATDDELLAHCQTVAQILPIFGFYLQPAAGGRVLSYGFWRRFAEISTVIGIKIAPFNRYQTLDVVRAVAAAGRTDIALYTGNDDNIVLDLLTPFRFESRGRVSTFRIVGGLLGHWAVWTRNAVEIHSHCRRVAKETSLSNVPALNAPTRAAGCSPSPPGGRPPGQETTGERQPVQTPVHSEGGTVPAELLARAVEITDSNAAFFDAANGYVGCIPGIHEVLRRQGLFEGIWCLDAKETLSPGQREEIDRVYRAYPHLNDDAFVAEHRDAWLSG